ncbi:MAG: PDZ domain-containing protein [Candidatus Marinimicrobia bacterium]|nr:PDZ domain-containing protein [Candidatus Neomarinimicrobiota bacterium]
MDRFRSVFGSVIIIAVFSLAMSESAIAKKKGWLGVSIQTVNEDLKDDWDLQKDQGVLVTDVIENSPADEAGIKRGDVIIEYEGRKVKYADELREYVLKTPPGETAKIKVDRDGKSKNFDVEIERRRSNIVARNWCNYDRMFGFTFDRDEGGFLGVDMYDMTDGLREYFKLKDDEGVLVVNVVEDSPAEKAGFKSGDVITKVGKRSIEDSADLRKAISRSEPDEEVKIEYVRNKKRSSVKVKIGDREDFENDDIRIFRSRINTAPKTFHYDFFDHDFDMNIMMQGLRNEIDFNLRNSLKGLKENLYKTKEIVIEPGKII